MPTSETATCSTEVNKLRTPEFVFFSVQIFAVERVVFWADFERLGWLIIPKKVLHSPNTAD